MCSPLFVYLVSQCLHPSSCPYIIFLEIILNFFQPIFLVSFIYYTLLPTHLQSMRYPSMCTDEWHPTASHSAPTIEKALELCHNYVQNQVPEKMHTPREFPGYWWLFRMQYLSRYNARLVEEKR